MKTFKGIALVFAAAVLILTGVVLARALGTSSRQLSVAPIEPVALDQNAVLQRLSGAIQIATVTRSDGPLPSEALEQLHAYLETHFPRVHKTLTVDRVAGFSLLYRWEGRDPEAEPAV
ncbi:MAG: hypothetical protein AAFQ82_23485, partial [Myxococcota bacterium]